MAEFLRIMLVVVALIAERDCVWFDTGRGMVEHVAESKGVRCIWPSGHITAPRYKRRHHSLITHVKCNVSYPFDGYPYGVGINLPVATTTVASKS